MDLGFTIYCLWGLGCVWLWGSIYGFGINGGIGLKGLGFWVGGINVSGFWVRTLGPLINR